MIVGTVLSFLLVGFMSLAGKRADAPPLVMSRASFGMFGDGMTPPGVVPGCRHEQRLPHQEGTSRQKAT
jgi:hypothetical protein